MGFWARWKPVRERCLVCRQVVERGEFTCGEEGCELAASQGQAMLASFVMEQEMKVAKRVRWAPTLPSADIELV